MSDFEGEGNKGEIMAGRDEISSIWVSLIFLRRWWFQLEKRKKSKMEAVFLRVRAKIRGKANL